MLNTGLRKFSAVHPRMRPSMLLVSPKYFINTSKSAKKFRYVTCHYMPVAVAKYQSSSKSWGCRKKFQYSTLQVYQRSYSQVGHIPPKMFDSLQRNVRHIWESTLSKSDCLVRHRGRTWEWIFKDFFIDEKWQATHYIF